MVAATKLQFEFRRRLNRIDSKLKKDFEPDEIDSYLNEAKDILYSKRLDLLETIPQIREELKALEVKELCLSCKAHKTNKDACVVTLPEDYYRKSRYRALIFKDANCGDKDAFVRLLSSDKLTEALKDPMRDPSYEYEEVLMDEFDGGFIVYHNRKFDVKKICIDYFKKLKDIASPSLTTEKKYTNSSGELIEVDQGLVIDNPVFVNLLLDIAALSAGRDLGAVQDFQTQLNKIASLQKL